MTKPRRAGNDTAALRKLFDSALADHRAGRLMSAKAKYAELLRLDPDAADAAHLLGQILFAEGDVEAALASVEQAIKRNRREPRYHITLSSMLNRLGRAREAETAARRAIAFEKRDAAAYVNLGIALIAREAFEEAERALGRALQLAPNDAVALSNLGTVHLNTGRAETAVDFFRRAVGSNPKNAVAWANLAEAAHDLGRADESLAAAERALAIDPRHAPAHAILGTLRLEAGVVHEAVACCERALALRPSESKFLGNLANALLSAGRPEAALAAYESFLARLPGDSRALANLPTVLLRAGRLEAAIEACDTLIAKNRDDSQATYTKSLCQLLMGAIDAGLEGYEARWGVPSVGLRPRPQGMPSWSAEAPAETRLFVWAEQGIGDHLFNAGFLPGLLRSGARCTYECDPRLVELTARSFPEVKVVPLGAPPPDHDHQIPAGSVLRVLRTRLGTMPERSAWLRPHVGRVADFGKRLADWGPGPYVGISWRSARQITGAHKSMPLAEWQPILRLPGVRFVNLQYGDTSDEVATASAATGAAIYTDPDLDRFADIDGVAALIAASGLVITTSNVTAHIASALGRETWVALQKVPLWYWELEGESSRYYPSLRLFRQREVGTWQDVALSIATALIAFLEKPP